MAGHYLPNTRIAIDIWEETPERKLNFLSHFHETQIIGLTSKWKRSIYTSKVTAKYLENVIKVQRKYLKVLEMNKVYTIFHKDSQERFSVAVICAFHCPGAVMFLFEGSFGRILYTGHCRYKPPMLENPALAQIIAKKNLDVMFLDNMYAAPECKFPSDVECLKQVIEIIRVNPERKILLAMSHEDEAQVLFCLVKVLKQKIFVCKDKYKIVQKLVEGEIRDLFTDNPSQSLIHAVGLQSIASERDKDKSVVTILLTVEYQFQDKIFDCAEESDTYIIPYSTHSSHSELVDFVSQLCPKKTVPIIVETSSKYAVIPKQLQDLKEQRTMRPRKKLSLSRNHMRNKGVFEEVDEEVTAKINEDKTCFSKENPVLELDPASKKGDMIESSENDVVVCSDSSHLAMWTNRNFAHGPLSYDGHELSISLSCKDLNARMDVGHVSLPDPDVFDGAVALKEELDLVEEDRLSVLTASSDRVELDGMIGITLHQSCTQFHELSPHKITKVNCGVQTEGVCEANIHSVDHAISNEGTFLPSIYLLPLEVRHRMKFKLCECDSCIVSNKRRHSKMFPREVPQFETIIDNESDELEQCSVLLPCEYESIFPVVDESIPKHGSQNKINLTNANTRNAGSISVHATEYSHNSSEAVDNVLVSAVEVTSGHLQFPARFSKHLAECAEKDSSPASQSHCTDGGGGLLESYIKSVSQETSGMESNTCYKTNSREKVIIDGLKLSSQHVTTTKDMTSRTSNQDGDSCMVGRTDSSNKICAKSKSNCKPHQGNFNASPSKQQIFLEYLNLHSKCEQSDTSSKNNGERHSKLNEMYSNKCTSSLLAPKGSGVSNSTSLMSTTSTNRDLNRVKVTAGSGIKLCCKVVVDRLKPEQISGYSCSRTQKEVELKQTTNGEPGGASFDRKLDALQSKNNDKAYINDGKKNVMTYFNQQQSTQHASSEQKTFFSSLSGPTKNLKNGSNSNETFYSAVNDSVCGSRSSSVNVNAEKPQFNKILNSKNVALKRKWDSRETIFTKLSKKDPNVDYMDCDNTSTILSATLNSEVGMSEDEEINVVACLNGDTSSDSSSTLDELCSIPKSQDDSVSKCTNIAKCGKDTNESFCVSTIDEVSNDRGANTLTGTLVSDLHPNNFSTYENDDSCVSDFIKKDCENSDPKKLNFRVLLDDEKQCPGRELRVVLRSVEDIQKSRAVSPCTSVDSNSNFIKNGLSKANAQRRKIHNKKQNQFATSSDASEHSVVNESNGSEEPRDKSSVFGRDNFKRRRRRKRILRQQPKKFHNTGVSANKNECSKECEGRNATLISTTISKHNVNSTGNGLSHDVESSDTDDCIIVKDTMRDRYTSNSVLSKLRSRTQWRSLYKIPITKD